MFDHTGVAQLVNPGGNLSQPSPVDEWVPITIATGPPSVGEIRYMADLRTLIADRKGDRSYEQLAQACGGNPGAPRLHQMATKPIKGFPDPDTIRGLSKGLSVTEMTIVFAAAESLGLDMRMPDNWAALLPAGTERLPSHLRDAILAVVHSAVRLVDEHPQAADAESDGNVTALRAGEDSEPARVTRAARRRTRPSDR